MKYTHGKFNTRDRDQDAVHDLHDTIT